MPDDDRRKWTRAELRTMTPDEVLAINPADIQPNRADAARRKSDLADLRKRGLTPDQILEAHRNGELDHLIKPTKENN